MNLLRSLHLTLVPVALAVLGTTLAACGSDSEVARGGQSAPFADGLSALAATKAPTSPKNSVFIRPMDDHSLCLAVVGQQNRNGAQVAIETCDENDASQRWAMSGSQLKIFGDKCLDVTSGRDQDGVKLQIWTCGKTNSHQAWAWQAHNLKWANHGRCLDLTDGAKQPGTLVQMWACTRNNTNQDWRVSSGGPTPTSTSSQATEPTLAEPGTQAASNHDTLSRLSVSGSNLVDAKGEVVQLRGTNLGGWLVTENWMCGMTDATDGTGRFARETLEKRFGEKATDTFLNLWYDTWLTTDDFDNMKSLGMNVARIPFGWRNLQHADGSWRLDAQGNIDFTRLDWAVNELAQRGIYSILDFHIWDSQQQSYSRISENSSQSAIDQQHAAAIWTQTAKHFANNSAIAGYDIINEPTGSGGNKMQDVLYQAVRAQDATRPIIMESVSAHPDGMKWHDTVYSFHEYNMMGEIAGTNESAFKKDDAASMAKWKAWPVPVYIGEFMAQGDSETLSYMIKAFNQRGYSWTNWTLKTVDMGSWGLYSLHPKNAALDVAHDSIATLTSKVKALGSASEQQPTLTTFKQAIDAR